MITDIFHHHPLNSFGYRYYIHSHVVEGYENLKKDYFDNLRTSYWVSFSLTPLLIITR